MTSKFQPTCRAPHWLALAVFFGTITSTGISQWRFLTAGDQRQSHPPKNSADGTPIMPGDRWPTDAKFRWLIGELEIPEVIGKEPSNGKVVGLQINCGDGGEVFVGDEFQARYDNDHPALVLLADKATAGSLVQVAT